MRSIDEVLLFHPVKHPQGYWEPQGLEFEDAWFKAKDGTQLHGWYCPAREPKAVMLIAHGNGGNLSYLGPRLAVFQSRWNVTAMAFDYRGYGRCEGKPSVEGVLQTRERHARFWPRRLASTRRKSCFWEPRWAGRS